MATKSNVPTVQQVENLQNERKVITLMDSKKLIAMIDGVIRDDQSLDARKFATLLQSAAHAAEHGNVTYVTKLLNGVRNWNELYAWLTRYTPIRHEGLKQDKSNAWPNLVFKELPKDAKNYVPYAFEGVMKADDPKHFDEISSFGEAGDTPYHSLPEVEANRNRVITEATIFGFIPKLTERVTVYIKDGKLQGAIAAHAARKAQDLAKWAAEYDKQHPEPTKEQQEAYLREQAADEMKAAKAA